MTDKQAGTGAQGVQGAKDAGGTGDGRALRQALALPSNRDRLDLLMSESVERAPGLPGVVAMVSDREGNVYESAVGLRRIGELQPMTTDTVLALFSLSKSITSTAALQLVEQGLLDLDAPAQDYAPELGRLQVLEGVDAQGNEKLRAPRSSVTTRQLLTHTSGLGYDFLSAEYQRRIRAGLQPDVATATKASLMVPLLFDPGQRWEYGIGIDWVGQVIEGITGQSLGQALQQRLFAPLGMNDTRFEPDEAMQARQASLHVRKPDGHLHATRGGYRPPEVHMGGQGLYGTVGDYMKFIRMWLCDGAGENGVVLQPATVQMASQAHLAPHLAVTALRSNVGAASLDLEFFPGVRKSWSLAFMRNEEQTPTGRPAGSQGWAGLANLYCWVDRENGVGGMWAAQVLPFGDPAALGGALALETAVYRALHPAAVAADSSLPGKPVGQQP